MSLVLASTILAALLLTFVARSVLAQDDQQCRDYLSDMPFLPGSSCEDIYNKNQRSRTQPGYYWILDGPSRVYCGMSYSGPTCIDIYITHSVTRDKAGYYLIANNWAYCDMVAIADAFSRGELITSCVGMGGLWRRIASFNIAAGDNCPSPWIKSSYSGISFCRSPSDDAGCHSVIYSSSGRHYFKVCGWASGYQRGSPDGFRVWHPAYFDYFEGLSITHGNPRQHIWTYAVGITDSGSDHLSQCPCAAESGESPSAFVGSDYYCESGAGSSWSDVNYMSDVLWDGAGCSSGNNCCSNSNLPWFYRELSQSTQDDIEVRMCMDERFDNEAVLITSLTLYIQ